MRDSKVIGTGAALLTVGACAAICLSFAGGFGPRVQVRTHESTGWMMAQQAISLLKPGGEIIVITRDTAAFKNPASDLQLEAFHRALRAARVSVSRTQALQVDPLRAVEVPPEDFFELIRTCSKGSVIVSFMGPPILTEEQRKQLGEVKPSIVAFCSGSLPERIDLRTLLDQGLLHAAVVSRRNSAQNVSGAKNLKAWFDASFLAINAANAATIAGPSDPTRPPN